MENHRVIFSDKARRTAFIKKAKIIIVVGGVVGVLMGGFIGHQLSRVFAEHRLCGVEQKHKTV